MKQITIAISSLITMATPIWSATTFITNNTPSKTLALNESDGAPLEGTGKVGTTDTLSLSSDDGGGNINITTTAMTGSTTLGMDGDSMGNGNDKWGNGQSWTFQFDKTISFDEIDMFSYNETMTLRSTAWIGAANTTGTGWTFDGSTGTFSLLGNAGSDPIFDFTSAGVPNVAAATDIFFGYTGGANGGEQMRSFTITVIPDTPTVIPEPSSMTLLGFACLGLALRRRRI